MNISTYALPLSCPPLSVYCTDRLTFSDEEAFIKQFIAEAEGEGSDRLV